MRKVRGIVLPFPGGVVRAGSKVGAKHYKKMIASTNDAFCPTLAPLSPRTGLLPGERSVLEIVIDGLDEGSVAAAMRAGIAAVVARGAQAGITRISAGNYGGKLGPFHFRLHALAPGSDG